MADRNNQISPAEIISYSKGGATIDDLINYFEITGPSTHDFRNYINDLTERGLLLTKSRKGKIIFFENPAPPPNQVVELREHLKVKVLDYISKAGADGTRKPKIIADLHLNIDEKVYLGKAIESLKEKGLIYSKGYSPTKYFKIGINNENKSVGPKIISTISAQSEISLDCRSPIRAEDLAGIIYSIIRLKHQEFMKKEAISIADKLICFFGYSDRIIDNILEPEERDVFYMLEEYKILKTEREHTTLFDGREWRTNYWILDRRNVAEILGIEFKNEGYY